GAKGEAGDPAKNLGVVVLLVPLKNHRAGTGQIFIATGRGAEGFLTDAPVGRIRDAMTPYLYNAYIRRFPQVLTAKLLGKRPRAPTSSSRHRARRRRRRWISRGDVP